MCMAHMLQFEVFESSSNYPVTVFHLWQGSNIGRHVSIVLSWSLALIACLVVVIHIDHFYNATLLDALSQLALPKLRTQCYRTLTVRTALAG